MEDSAVKLQIKNIYLLLSYTCKWSLKQLFFINKGLTIGLINELVVNSCKLIEQLLSPKTVQIFPKHFIKDLFWVLSLAFFFFLFFFFLNQIRQRNFQNESKHYYNNSEEESLKKSLGGGNLSQCIGLKRKEICLSVSALKRTHFADLGKLLICNLFHRQDLFSIVGFYFIGGHSSIVGL